MIVSIHQPHYLPWLPYVGKILRSGVFVVLDDVEFTRNGWQNRNRIKTSQGPLVLTVPVKQKLGQHLLDARVLDDGWRRKHWQSVQQAYAKAPYFSRFESDLKNFFAEPWHNLVDPCCAMLAWLLKTLEADVKILRSSTLEVQANSSLRLVEIVKTVGGDTYLSGAHALQAYLDPTAFLEANVGLALFEWHTPEYCQLHPSAGFLRDPATLDALLNLGPEKCREVALSGGTLRGYETPAPTSL